MRRLLSIVLLLICSVVFISCGNKKSNENALSDGVYYFQSNLVYNEEADDDFPYTTDELALINNDILEITGSVYYYDETDAFPSTTLEGDYFETTVSKDVIIHGFSYGEDVPEEIKYDYEEFNDFFDKETPSGLGLVIIVENNEVVELEVVS